MTDATAEPAAAPARPARTGRRVPSELSFVLDESYVEECAANEPEWLVADRRAAFAKYRALPVEANQLYTTYVDLRTADLAAVTPWQTPDGAPDGPSLDLPDGAAGLAAFRDECIDALTIDADAPSPRSTIVRDKTATCGSPTSQRRTTGCSSRTPAGT